MQTVLRNLRFALRMMGRNMGLTAAAVLTLALGIGANSAIFTVTNALLLKPFPYRDPARLVSVEVRDRKEGAAQSPGRVSRMYQLAVRPPSTRRSMPVIAEAWSEARNRNAWAISSVVTSRFIGTRANDPLR